MKKPVEYFDTDFLDNKIELGDKVIIEEPKYRNFIIGTVVTKAPKSCQIEYVDFVGSKQITRQYYGQIIKYPIKEGRWIMHTNSEGNLNHYECSECHQAQGHKSNYCEECGAKMCKEDHI
jgi:hypothetical protein